MFIRRSKYECEKLIAKQRIEKLEHMICPNGHNYKNIGIKSYLEEDVYVCSRCGKIK